MSEATDRMLRRRAYWLRLKGGARACAWVTEQGLEDYTRAGAEVLGVLGYPARPRLDDGDHWGPGGCPSFCVRPSSCARPVERGAGSCSNPGGRSCTD